MPLVMPFSVQPSSLMTIIILPLASSTTNTWIAGKLVLSLLKKYDAAVLLF